jgi:hypothetical protein
MSEFGTTRSAAMSAIPPLLGDKRTSRGESISVAIDPTRTFDLIIVCVAGWGICHSTDVRGCELGTRLRMRL